VAIGLGLIQVTNATRGGRLTLVLYDLTTLYVEIPREDGLRKSRMSKKIHPGAWRLAARGSR
jgi:hypothetical protein